MAKKQATVAEQAAADAGQGDLAGKPEDAAAADAGSTDQAVADAAAADQAAADQTAAAAAQAMADAAAAEQAAAEQAAADAAAAQAMADAAAAEQAATARAAEPVLVRVLVDGPFGRVNDVTRIAPDLVAAAQAVGEVDSHPDAVAYARSLQD